MLNAVASLLLALLFVARGLAPGMCLDAPPTPGVLMFAPPRKRGQR